MWVGSSARQGLSDPTEMESDFVDFEGHPNYRQEPTRTDKRSGLKAPADPSRRVPTYIVYFFKFILGEDFS